MYAKVVILKLLTARLWHSFMVIKDPSNKNHKALPRIIFPFLWNSAFFSNYYFLYQRRRKIFSIHRNRNFCWFFFSCFFFSTILCSYHNQHKLTRKLFIEFKPKLCYHQQDHENYYWKTNCKQQKLPLR